MPREPSAPATAATAPAAIAIAKAKAKRTAKENAQSSCSKVSPRSCDNINYTNTNHVDEQRRQQQQQDHKRQSFELFDASELEKEKDSSWQAFMLRRDRLQSEAAHFVKNADALIGAIERKEANARKLLQGQVDAAREHARLATQEAQNLKEEVQQTTKKLANAKYAAQNWEKEAKKLKKKLQRQRRYTAKLFNEYNTTTKQWHEAWLQKHGMDAVAGKELGAEVVTHSNGGATSSAAESSPFTTVTPAYERTRQSRVGSAYQRGLSRQRVSLPETASRISEGLGRPALPDNSTQSDESVKYAMTNGMLKAHANMTPWEDREIDGEAPGLELIKSIEHAAADEHECNYPTSSSVKDNVHTRFTTAKLENHASPVQKRTMSLMLRKRTRQGGGGEETVQEQRRATYTMKNTTQIRRKRLKIDSDSSEKRKGKTGDLSGQDVVEAMSEGCDGGGDVTKTLLTPPAGPGKTKTHAAPEQSKDGYFEVVRGREREELPGFDCSQCNAWYKEIGRTCDPDEVAQGMKTCTHSRVKRRGGGEGTATIVKHVEQDRSGAMKTVDGGAGGAGNATPANASTGGGGMVNAVSRHRYRYAPPATPPGFWDVASPETNVTEAGPALSKEIGYGGKSNQSTLMGTAMMTNIVDEEGEVCVGVVVHEARDTGGLDALSPVLALPSHMADTSVSRRKESAKDGGWLEDDTVASRVRWNDRKRHHKDADRMFLQSSASPPVKRKTDSPNLADVLPCEG